MFIINIVLGLLFASVSNPTSGCDVLSGFKQLMTGPQQSRYEYQARYVNLEYKFAVIIPEGLKAYDGRDQARHNGFALPLASDSVIFVSGDPNSMGYYTPRNAALQEVECLRQQGKKIDSETMTDSHLGALNAVLLTVTYTCPASTDPHIESSVLALSDVKNFFYEVLLYDSTNRYEHDRAVLDQLVKSWKIISGTRRHPQGAE